MRVLRSRWTLPCFLALAAALWLTWALPRLHPAARLKLQYDRDAYIALSRQFASAHGLDVTGWAASLKTETLAKNQDLRLMMPDSAMARMFPDAQVTATLIPPGKSAGAQITFRSDGRPLGWKFPASVPMKPGPMTSPDAAMHELSAEHSDAYKMTTAGAATGDQDFEWQRDTGVSSPQIAPHIAIDASAKNGAVWHANTVFTIPEAIAKKFDSFPLTRTIVGAAWYVIFLAALVVSILREGSGRTARAMRDTSVICLSVAAALALMAGSLLEWDDQIADVPGASGALTEILGVTVGALVMGIMFYAVLAGTVVNAGLHPARVRGFRLLGTRAILSRTVARELLAGWLFAPLIVALPLVVSALLRAPVFRGYDDSVLLSRWPAPQILLSSAEQSTLAVVGLLGLLIPLALRLFRRPAISGAAALLFGAMTCVMQAAPFREALAANIAWAAVAGAVFIGAWYQFGMLASVSAYGWAKILNGAVVMYLQPASGLHGSGLAILALFGTLGLIVLLVSWKGPDAVAELYGESAIRLEPRSRREELLAEFNVARSAQQQMLPARPPALEGYTLAASCDPAREVGGDLYDFLRLKDGRWGIGVADVSGKGVPAALYMTLTKGLLSAASQDSGDPHYILGVVNKHLRTVVKKKVFVTMALGVLDPDARTMEYARAGHNPVVWRRTSAGETHLLGGPGIGLGIAGPVLFGKTLKTQNLALAPGDAIVFYSDGLTEAMNEALEQFGEDRLVAATERADGLDAGATRDSILREVKRFLKGGNSQDDLTIAVLRVNDVRAVSN